MDFTENCMTFSSMIPRLIYSILYAIALIFLLPFQYRKRPKEFRGKWLMEKFGFFNYKLQIPKSPLPPFSKGGHGGIIWIHAVSVGEVIASMSLIRRLKERLPGVNFIVSTITDTGQKVAIEKSPEGTQVLYLPFDLAFILKRALKDICPALFIAMETELWPNLFRALKRQNIPALIMNGRISDDSFRGYKKIRFFLKDMISCIDIFCMQDSVYAQRIKELGASEDRVRVLGNFKFDTRPSANIPEWTELLAPPVIIAGSTHRGEEDLVVSVYSKLKNDFPDLNLIIAPRHPDRFKEVEDLVRARGLAYKKRSELVTRNSRLGESPGATKLETLKGCVVLLDAVGELASVYASADIAIIGGSFIPHGGQNLLEPAYWAKPILCGTHMENFPFAKEFYEKGAAMKVDAASLFEKLRDLLLYPEKMEMMGKKAKEMCDEKSGAVEKAVKIIEEYLFERSIP
ncbi:MAG: 3-deoxy-D-manno-octulosonic acid transferase [Nitrospirae bacterium]|nr:3-deoxy-D-manno-octulosonic acid transferase [Nitrospirota bacterium]